MKTIPLENDEMVSITKVYTRQGDAGSTRLAGGQEVSKSSPRIEAYGSVDELNACMGLVAEALRGQEALHELRAGILRIQNELFDLGSQLAVLPPDRRETTPVVSASMTTRLETEIDTMNEHLPALRSFILPGGGEVAARLHLARTVCRRAERRTLEIDDGHPLDETEVPYLNRLSDWLFVASRLAAAQQSHPETLWEPGASR